MSSRYPTVAVLPGTGPESDEEGGSVSSRGSGVSQVAGPDETLRFTDLVNLHSRAWGERGPYLDRHRKHAFFNSCSTPDRGLFQTRTRGYICFSPTRKDPLDPSGGTTSPFREIDVAQI